MSKNFTFAWLLILTTIIFISIYYNSFAKIKILPSEISEDDFVIKGKVAKVIDGDSIIINNYEMRLVGIDAPEYKQECTDKYDKKYNCGKKSREFLNNLIYKKSLNCKVIGRDYYERYLTICYKEQLNINAHMVKTGHAIIYNSDSPYYSLQQIAKKSKLGIWQGDFLTPKQYRKLNKK